MITRFIDRNFANMRLDRFLRKAFPDESLSVFFAVIRKKKVRVNGVVGKANQMLQEGDTVCIYENFKSVENNSDFGIQNSETKDIVASSEGTKQPSTGFAKAKSTWGKTDERLKTRDERNASWGAKELDIVIQTEDYVVVNKPSGLASQPGSGTRPGESLVEYLWEWGRREGLDFKPTIAHRLDQETSGMIIAALHGDTLRDFTRMIREHEVDKFYYALVKGNLKKDKGTINETLTRTDAAKGSKMKVGETGKDAQQAITHYRVKQHYEGYDLVKIKLETGRMHQIRAHFASIGHPLLGDTRYGDFALNREVKKQLGLHRLFLHSCRLEFVWHGDKIVLDCPLPKELQSVVDQLKPIRHEHR
ncbi:RluA family pseudouridine synthase [Fibrobacter sp. UWH4]|uniref:RluA family pseudouridine synthase n=1 Tax=Fibrobacter sp. UWH4 TaxID=1896210 RepID=UPI000914317B|nr:RluA family pseudouridine synthase [Fibrobacter sp. UWH4]SHK93479.1 23S rRNA pseudouridine955/2504/2580 synthase [Fibrobacter sp. UWH4]